MIYFVDAEELWNRVGKMQIVEVVEAWASEDDLKRIDMMMATRRRKVPLLDGIAIAQDHDDSSDDDLPSDS